MSSPRILPVENSSRADSPPAALEDPDYTANSFYVAPNATEAPTLPVCEVNPAVTLLFPTPVNSLPTKEEPKEPIDLSPPQQPAATPSPADHSPLVVRKKTRASVRMEANPTLNIETFLNAYDAYKSQSITLGSFLMRLRTQDSMHWKQFAQQQLQLNDTEYDNDMSIVATLLAIAKDPLWAEQGKGIFSSKTPKGITLLRELAKQGKATEIAISKLATIAMERAQHTLKQRKPITRDFYELITFLASPELASLAHKTILEHIAIRLFCNQYQLSFNKNVRLIEKSSTPLHP